MSFRDLILMMWVCLSLASSAVVARYVLTDLDVEPLTFTAIRSLIVVLCTLPWLFPIPKPRLWFLLTGLLFGLGGFTLFFMGLKYAQPSSVAIVSQLTIPFTTLLGIILLGERLTRRRMFGTILAIVGILAVMWRPGGFGISPGLFWVVLSAVASSAGVITLKKIPDLNPIRLQAWVALTAAMPCAIITSFVDVAPWTRAIDAGWPLILAAVYSAVAVSLLGQTVNYRLLGRHDAHVTAPLMVMAPVFTMILGVLFTGDIITVQLMIGTGIALAGVFIIVSKPPNPKHPERDAASDPSNMEVR